METSKASLQIKPLRFSEEPTDYLLYKAALEWDLIDPIVIEKPEDIKSTRSWIDKVEPFQHQVSNLINFCRRLPVTLLADDVGLGKTISAGLVASELISRGRLSKILIVCPKILGQQWEEELRIKFGIPSVIVIGRELLSAEPPGDFGAVITTYNSARMYLDQLRESGFDMLILDEAHKLRNLYGTDAAPQVALSFKKVLADRVFKYVLLLTATPIQNRLWDLYSLVDLLTVARGHQNPFGNPGSFARKFIADNRTDARRLNPEAQEEFRSIIYGYMSRVRRGDADLHFPEREVQLHTVDPSPEELQLIDVVATHIDKIDRLNQINILKTLVSSPEALSKMLSGMAERGTAGVKKEFATEVKSIVKNIKLTAKLQGLEALVDKLRAEKPTHWRMVIFATRIETQTSIQNFLEDRGISCGIINGTTTAINKETLEKFRKENPDINVIISTEAGSEGVNLQVANVLVNYDLPWNPMIVEQRIGRVQRLGSLYEKVCIFNIVLKSTFEEYIVGRLMEKLQMATSAIGDIESLLQASGLCEGDDSSEDFEDKILKLVLASVKGKDVTAATERAKRSIESAKVQLKKEEENINTLLGNTDSGDSGPQSPILPKVVHSMEEKEFVLEGLQSLGAVLTSKTPDLYLSVLNDKQELIRFDNNLTVPLVDGPLFKNVLYSPGSPAFERLVTKLTNTGLHRVVDADQDSTRKLREVSKKWVKEIDAELTDIKVINARRCFSGSALIRARVTVAHDSYERLIEVPCIHTEHVGVLDNLATEPLDYTVLNNSAQLGLSHRILVDKTLLDSGVSEFCRFYRERLIHEMKNAGTDAGKRKKLEDDFTPRLEFTLVGLEGFVRRQFPIQVSYHFDNSLDYVSELEILPSLEELVFCPKLGKCTETNRLVPEGCLERCAISKGDVLKHLLIKSEASDRKALPKFIVKCEYTGKNVLSDEVSKSEVSGRIVLTSMLKESPISRKRGEPDLFARCDFTNTEVLISELKISEISGKKYREDEEVISSVSGKIGNRSEFIFCSETKQPLLLEESEKCEATGKIVTKGILEKCEVTKKRVVPSELGKSTITGKKALKKFFVSSSVSGAEFLENEGIKSITGKFCVPIEAKKCIWSGQITHPDDIRTCQITDLPVHFQYIKTKNNQTYLESLSNLLDGISHKSDEKDTWSSIVTKTTEILGNRKNEIESTELSLDGELLAICMQVRTMLGLKMRHAGFIYSKKDNIVLGRIGRGKREVNGWIQT